MNETEHCNYVLTLLLSLEGVKAGLQNAKFQVREKLFIDMHHHRSRKALADLAGSRRKIFGFH